MAWWIRKNSAEPNGLDDRNDPRRPPKFNTDDDDTIGLAGELPLAARGIDCVRETGI